MFQAIAQFRQRLQQGEFLIGAAVTLTDPRVSEALADSVDFLWYDMEHTTLSPEALVVHLIALVRQRFGMPAGLHCDVMVKGTWHVAQACGEQGVRRLINISSVSAAGRPRATAQGLSI